MVTARSGRTGHGLRDAAAHTGAALIVAAVLMSGCAAHGGPPRARAVAEVPPAACENFARGEVRRIGESVPAALAKGFLVGLAADMSQILGVTRIPHGGGNVGGPVERQWMDPWWLERLWTEHQREEPQVPYQLSGPMVRAGSAPFPALVMGGPVLAHDAARTNEDVHRQAMEKCAEPARLAREFGPGNARVAASLEVLADAYMRQREYEQAEPLRREAAAIWTALFGPTDSKVARALDDHAAALRGLHRNPEADALSARAAEVRAQLAALKAQRPSDDPKPSIEHSCDAPVNAALFAVCRHAPPALEPRDPILVAQE